MCWFKRALSAVMLTVMPLVAMAFSTWDGASAAPWTKGSGAASSPYIIETAEQLAYLAQQVNAGTTYSGKYFKMAADIDLNGKQWTPIGDASHAFSGYFDGGHHIVYNLAISTADVHNVGLFGNVTDGGLKNIAVENCKIAYYDKDGYGYTVLIGAVAAYIKNSDVLECCYATGTTNVYNEDGHECAPYESHYTITSGVFGKIESTDVKYCYNAVEMTEGTHRDIGALIGIASGSTIEYCYNVADIRGLYCRAGILGWSNAGISNVNKIHYCYNTGHIMACQPIGDTPDNNNHNGGILGCPTYTTIRNCYDVGPITNYPNKPSFAMSQDELTSTPRVSNFCLNTLSGLSPSVTANGAKYPITFFEGKNNALMFLGNSYRKDDNNTNKGLVIHKHGVYNTETCDVNKTGELQVMLDASVYAHNRAYRGIAWGLGEDIDAWSKVNTTDSVLNHIGLKDLEYDVKYGYIAYQMTPDGLKYGDDKYFLFKKDKFCDGDGYSYKGHSYTTGGDVVVVDKDTTVFLHLDMIEKPEVTLPEVSECYEYTWEGQTTKTSTVLKTVVKSVLCGCDSTTYQPVTIKDSVVVELPAVSECYEYTWEGQTTKKSARLRKMDVGANGCDSITYQPVTIRDSVVVTLPLVKACNFYDWEGMHTETSVDFRKLDTGVNGCDSITYQPVEIFYSVEEHIEDTSYVMEPYKKNGFDLPKQSEIGDFNYELHLVTPEKCDSTVYLILHVIPNTTLDVIPDKFVEYRDGRFNWQIKNVENYPNIHILIYDRFSRKVAEYRGYDNNNGWDGRYNGHLLPATDYWYWMKDDLIPGILSGHFTLYYKQGQW